MRLVLALERVPFESSILEPVLELAKGFGSAIDALLLQSDSLARYALLPFAQELDLRTGQARALSTHQLEQSWFAELRRLETLFQNTMQPREVRFTIQTARGDLAKALATLSAEQEAVTAAIVGGLASLRLSRPALMAARSKRRLIGTYVNQSEEAVRTLAIAADLAKSTGRGLFVTAHPEMKDIVAAALHENATLARVASLSSESIVDIVNTLATPDNAILIVPASMGQDLPVLARLLAPGPERLLVLAR